MFRSRLSSRAFVTLLVLAAGGVWLLAHEGHDTTVRPIYKQVQAGASAYRIGFALMPQDPVVGEDVRFEFQILQGTDDPAGGSSTPVAAADPQVQIVSNSATTPASRIVTGEKPGTFGARHRFSDAGDFGISVRARAGQNTVAAEFPAFVRPGPVVRAAIFVDAAVVLVIAALVFSLRRRRVDDDTARGVDARVAGAIAAGVVVLVAAHLVAAPRIGRLFLPERHFGTVAWQDGAPGAAPGGAVPPSDEPGTPPHTHPPGTPPHEHPPKQGADAGAPVGRDVVSTVVPVPGQLVDVVVPASARVLFEGFKPRVGATVRRGQTLATLEHHYILHDAVHLLNQRWLVMVPMLAAKRAALQAELRLSQLRHLRERGEPAVRQMLQETRAVEGAELDVKTTRLEQERAVALLAMHDAEITQRELVRRPLVSPIGGTIEAVNFTQGQLKYENEKLFTILDLSTVWIESRFPAELAGQQPPKTMDFVSPAFPGRTFRGRLARVADALDAQTNTLSAFFAVANPDRVLRVGMRLAASTPSGQDVPVATADRVVRTSARDPENGAPPIVLAATVKPTPELTADVTAPLWGRIEFAGRRLAVGDHVHRGEKLLQIVLELSADERYPMNARAVEINSELQLAKTRRAQAEQQWTDAVGELKANKEDAFRREQLLLLERIHHNAQEEEEFLTRQAEAYKGTIQRRDPKITIVQAPISGVITHIGFRPGELNATGEFKLLLTIVDPSRVALEAPVYDLQSAALLTGTARARFSAPGVSERALDRPVSLSGAVDPATGALRVVYETPNPGGRLKIGATAQIVIDRN